jgi:hypothetical protein
MHTNANRGLCDDYCAGCNETKRYVSELDGKEYSRVIGVEYQGGYDGISEWVCPDCGRREGRWSGKVLEDGETEPRYGGQQ